VVATAARTPNTRALSRQRRPRGASYVPEKAESRTTPADGSMTVQEERRGLRRQARLFRALGHESRLVILTHLARGECCVCDLADVTGLDQSTVSKHLSLLSTNGIVDSERRGHHVYYRVIAPWVTELLRVRPWAPEKEG
jgi:ArsR family transcriptional regulator